MDLAETIFAKYCVILLCTLLSSQISTVYSSSEVPPLVLAKKPWCEDCCSQIVSNSKYSEDAENLKAVFTVDDCDKGCQIGSETACNSRGDGCLVGFNLGEENTYIYVADELEFTCEEIDEDTGLLNVSEAVIQNNDADEGDNAGGTGKSSNFGQQEIIITASGIGILTVLMVLVLVNNAGILRRSRRDVLEGEIIHSRGRRNRKPERPSSDGSAGNDIPIAVPLEPSRETMIDQIRAQRELVFINDDEAFYLDAKADVEQPRSTNTVDEEDVANEVDANADTDAAVVTRDIGNQNLTHFRNFHNVDHSHLKAVKNREEPEGPLPTTQKRSFGTFYPVRKKHRGNTKRNILRLNRKPRKPSL